MRQRLMQVLSSDEQDDLTTDVLRRFWSRAKPLPARPHVTQSPKCPDARVVDLAAWARAHRDVVR
jgi:hypothetical protein